MEAGVTSLYILQKWTGILVCVTALAAQANPQRLNSSCAEHYDKGRNCCNECQAGFYVSAPCTAERPVDCKSCGEGEYLEHSNSQTECLKQIECDEMKGFEILHKGDVVTAAQCVCRANYHCSQDCEYCLRDNPCPPGFEVKEEANRISDTKCGPCPPMHFSNETSLTVKCKLRTNCTALRMRQKVRGNATSDTMCASVGVSTAPVSDGSILAITVGLVCGCGIIILLFWALISHRKTSTTLTDCVQQRLADAWCSIRGQKRSEGNPPSDQAIGKLPSDNHDRDPESELFIPPTYPVKVADRTSGSIFYSFAEPPDCSSALNPLCGDVPLGQATYSPRTPREHLESKYSMGNGGEVSSLRRWEDLRTVNSTNPLLPAGCKVEESIHGNPSAQESRNNVQTQRSYRTPTAGSTTPLPHRQSNEGHAANCDGHTSHQSNYSHRSESIDGHRSNNTNSDHSNPGDENSHKLGNSTPSGFATYNTSGQSVLSVGGSVVFNVIVKVNHTTEQDSRGDGNDRNAVPGRKGTPRENDRFSTREEKPDAGCDFEMDAGLPVQEQHSEETGCLPVQEEHQGGSPGHQAGLSIQQQNCRENWGGSLGSSSKTVRQESQEPPKERTSLPTQEGGKSEHVPNREENY
ncbi:uncharacterized protein [Scyliorhinus torazame]|uniref:uncharacterized protein n=1 Tax=Scyliorhinus torazame TaxID=75743 RepID=UPI003B5A718A